MTDENQPGSTAKGEILQRTADLARLELSPAELNQLAPQFAAILEAFEVLSGLDVEGVPPTLSATDLLDIKRADTPRPSEAAEALLKGAPDRRGEHFAVPKTIGGSQ